MELPAPPPFQDRKIAALFEPRIELIRRQLLSLLTLVDLEHQGEPVTIDGFRLKNLRDWRGPSTGDPLEVFGYAGAQCNVDCAFCYHKGNPSELALRDIHRSYDETRREIETRLRFYAPCSGTALFPTLGNVCEVLAHRDILAILSAVRRKTQRPFRITTNGRVLTRPMIDALAELKPLYIYLSLHSSTEARRKQLLRDSEAAAAISALRLLQEARIPYAVVIVPWPAGSISGMVEDLINTVTFADAHEPHLIEVHLPGYSRYFSNTAVFDHEECWAAIVGAVRRLREEVTSPIVVMPSMYEENGYERQLNRPVITGMIRNSPAAQAGLQRGDLILGIGGHGVESRPQARDLLSFHARSAQPSVGMIVRRDSEELAVCLDLAAGSYPYETWTTSHLGIVMMGTGLRPSAIERLREIIDQRKARRVLLLASTLMMPNLRQALRDSSLFASRELTVEIAVPQNHFFGGNIIMGDLLVVEDFIRCIEDFLALGDPPPELVIIPSSPFSLGRYRRDLTGRVYLDIERETGVPVELLECETIFD